MESASRRKEFARLVAAGVPLDEAAKRVRIDPWRALRLVDSQEMLDLLRAVRPDAEITTVRDELAAVGGP